MGGLTITLQRCLIAATLSLALKPRAFSKQGDSHGSDGYDDVDDGGGSCNHRGDGLVTQSRQEPEIVLRSILVKATEGLSDACEEELCRVVLPLLAFGTLSLTTQAFKLHGGGFFRCSRRGGVCRSRQKRPTTCASTMESSARQQQMYYAACLQAHHAFGETYTAFKKPRRYAVSAWPWQLGVKGTPNVTFWGKW